MQEILLKNKILWKRVSKSLKKLTLFLLLNPVPFNGQSYQKLKGSGTSDQSFFRLQNKFRKILFHYMLSDQVWWCNAKQFLSYSKNYVCKFMQANSWHHKLLNFYLSFCIWKVWKGREKTIQNWISREWKELLRWNKKHFS